MEKAPKITRIMAEYPLEHTGYEVGIRTHEEGYHGEIPDTERAFTSSCRERGRELLALRIAEAAEHAVKAAVTSVPLYKGHF